eukprot:CAMPEP_0182442254 /NCGR_PEP_ID=MMETSP1172-20130603/1193_1 /TAXON_ID=708627 /ORGANISM="Timspurckia oligopyrenoides, Strain CCMP3278" /LENGTH=685 /DNA_ID=CAMNT_0024637013 /DNA_START=2375 /DNA_END=4432 /DNA_ORIENTATION=+
MTLSVPDILDEDMNEDVSTVKNIMMESSDERISSAKNTADSSTKKGTWSNADSLLNAEYADLIQYAALRMFHHADGVAMKDRTHGMRMHRNTVESIEILTFLMADLGLTNQREAELIAERFTDCAILKPVPKSTKKKLYPTFSKPKMLFHSPLTSKDVSKIKLESGNCVNCSSLDKTSKQERIDLLKKIHSESESSRISHVSVELRVDMTDLQSLDFWKIRVFQTRLEEKMNLGYQSVVHPFLLELNSEADNVKTESIGGEDSESSFEELNASDRSPVVDYCVVSKIFSSIARPAVLTMHRLDEDELLDIGGLQILPSVIVKAGDNLAQDMCVEQMFLCFNSLWQSHLSSAMRPQEIPYCVTYNVLPTSRKEGLLEVVPGLGSLNAFDWENWASIYASNDEVKDCMVRTAAGSYIGAYVLGVRDRHWDNILVQHNCSLVHIDFGFILGAVPPIDAPRFSVSSAMESAFRRVKIWDRFVSCALSAYQVLRVEGGNILRIASMLFSHAGFDSEVVRGYLQSNVSLAINVPEADALFSIRAQLQSSSKDWSTFLKQISHEHIDPAFYALLKAHFPPAMLAMKIVDAQHEQKLKSQSSRMLPNQSSFKKVVSGLGHVVGVNPAISAALDSASSNSNSTTPTLQERMSSSSGSLQQQTSGTSASKPGHRRTRSKVEENGRIFISSREEKS